MTTKEIQEIFPNQINELSAFIKSRGIVLESPEQLDVIMRDWLASSKSLYERIDEMSISEKTRLFA